MQKVPVKIDPNNYPESLRGLLEGADVYDSRCASVFNQIEEWGIAKSVAAHFASLYLAYVACYLVNTWIPFEWIAVAIFTGVFAGVYLVVWLVVFVSVKSIEKRLNKKLG